MSELKTLGEKVDAMTAKVNEWLKGNKKMKFAEVMTTDGKTLSYDGELAEGTAVMVDGAAAPDGAYTLEDGTTCNVAGGVIVSIAKPEMENDYTEKFAALEKRFEAIESRFDESGSAVNTKLEELGKLIADLAGNMTQTVEAVNKFAAMQPDPAEQPVSRKLEKLEKNVATGRRINDIVAEINKEKSNK